LSHLPGLHTGKALQNTGLMVGGKLFAFVKDGRLVLKLPAKQIDLLIEAHGAVRFDRNQGKPLKEWVVMPAAASDIWPALAEDAHRFVAGK
jgi:TfoX/Sxy family transcriptional regulator of competence genes